MNSKVGNAEKKPPAGDESGESTVEVKVEDRRRVSTEGEAVAEEPVEAAADISAENEELKARLKDAEDRRLEAEKQVRDFAERFRQAQAQLKAETEEQRTRLNRTFEQRIETARGEMVASLLDTLDNLKRAVAAAERSENRSPDFDSMLDGVRATAGMFEARMQALGLASVPGVGEEFNPEIHEAVEIVKVEAELDNRVVEEYQTGYKFGERLLRPARVKVGRA